MSTDVALTWAGTYDESGRPLAYFGGVPARDLTAAEVAALPDGLTAADLTTSGLYKAPGKPASKKDGDA